MTLAICLKCGKEKFGAFVPCPKCGYMPESPEDKARSIFLSDHVLKGADFNQVSEAIKQGRQVQFDEKAVAEFADQIAKAVPPKPNRLKGCAFLAGLFVGLVVLGTLVINGQRIWYLLMR